jgi:hypothetical protein
MRSDVGQGANASSVNQTKNMCDDDQAEGQNNNRLSTLMGAASRMSAFRFVIESARADSSATVAVR